ncbi:MAG: hypothetical protein ABIN01_18300 [Ferruginibacter sp.]
MTHRSKFQNTLCCILAALVTSCIMLRASIKYLSGWVPFKVQVILVLMGVLVTVIYTIIQKKKADRNGGDGNGFFAFWHSVLRYFLALDMISFALQKVFHLQFVIPLAMLDTPFSSMKGDDLIWAFFGKYYSFTLIIAGMQVLGAILLLFRRTWLLGIIVLLPIMFNILLLDWYYWITFVVNMYITILTAGAVYLLFTEYGSLAEFFFKAKSNLPTLSFKSGFQKNLIRVSAVLIPVLFLSTYKFPKRDPEIFGKYEVKNLVINDTLQTVQPCRDSLLTKVYIDNGDLVLGYNNDYKRIVIGRYTYDTVTKNITAAWHYPANHPDTLFAKILPGNTSRTKILSGRMGKENFKMELLKVE